ncbi:hypothetical protein Taro_043812 [Colocasia esculenta]|uniref:Peptidylprolyl isomerase n=1 Tax=Colocasia esculenta TaxID=4460 RepID=A0A843WKB6_COLES|nr:hypothetical protein [Colocasia esculenta]
MPPHEHTTTTCGVPASGACAPCSRANSAPPPPARAPQDASDPQVHVRLVRLLVARPASHDCWMNNPGAENINEAEELHLYIPRFPHLFSLPRSPRTSPCRHPRRPSVSPPRERHLGPVVTEFAGLTLEAPEISGHQSALPNDIPGTKPRSLAGVDLSDLAVEYSICPSKQNGGMLGWVRKGQMVPEFEEIAFSAPVNKVVRCKTKFGWHLLQVLSERSSFHGYLCISDTYPYSYQCSYLFCLWICREEYLLQDIEPVELHSKMQDPSFIIEAQLIDVREPDEVDKASLPGFKVLPLRQFGTWASDITNNFDSQKDTYVLCHHGMRSLQVAQWLQTQGFKRVFNVAGGIHAYALKADPSVPTY